MSIPNHVKFKLIYHLILLLQLPDIVPTLKRCRGKVWKWQEQRSLHTQYPCRIRSGSILVTASYGHYGQLWPLRPACSHNRAGSYMPDPTSRIRFSKEGMCHTVQNRPGFDLDGLARVWPNTCGVKASWCARIIGPGFWQDATDSLRVSHF